MIFLFIELPYFSQLKRVSPELIAEINSSVESSATNANGKIISPGSPFLIAFDEEIPGIRLQAAQAAFAIKNHLEQIKKKLFGFRLFLTAREEDSSEFLINDYKQKFLLTSPQENFQMDLGLEADFSDYFALQRKEGYFDITDFRFTHPITADQNQQFWLRSNVISFVEDKLGPFLSGESQGLLVFTGERLAAPMRNIERILSQYAGNAQIPLFRPRKFLPNPLAPLVTGLPYSDIPVSASRLGRSEKEAFEIYKEAYDYLSRTPFGRNPPALVAQRFGYFLELYLAGFCRDRAARALPSVVLVEDIDFFPDECVRVLQRVLKSISSDYNLIVVATAENAESLNRLKVDYEHYALPAASAEAAFNYVRSLAGRDEDENWDRALAEAWTGRPLSLYHSLILKAPSESPSQSYLRSLPDELREILFYLYFGAGILTPQRREDFLDRLGIMRQTQIMALMQLYQMGFILSETGAEPSLPDLSDSIESTLGKKSKALRAEFYKFLLSLSPNDFLPSLDFYPLLEAVGGPEANQAGAFMRSLIRESRLSNLEALSPLSQLERGAKASGLALPSSEDLSRYLTILKGFARGTAECFSVKEDGQLPVAAGSGGYFAGHVALARFSVEMARQHYREALTQAKVALLNFQSAKDIQGESAANRALGLYFLKNEQVYDSMDYFANASQTAEENDDYYELFMSQYYEALTFFIFGNYSRSRRLLCRALELSPRLFRPDLETQAIFLLGRVAYEIGDYEESAACLERALCVADTSALPEAAKRLRIWLSRSLAKTGSAEEALASLSAYPQDAEALLFTAEIRLAQGETEAALRFAEQSLAGFKPDAAYYTENPRFQSGYELAENICLLAQNSSEALRVQILATLSEIHRAQGNQQKAMEILYDVTRGMAVSENNPAIHYYYFAYFHAISEAQKVDEVYYQDKGTVLSKAFKYLQLRASRIDTAEDKASYMTNNPENKRLLEIARSFKFI
jgi:hypothetical protein